MQPLSASDLSLSQLKERFPLERNDDPNFFAEWQDNLPNLAELDRAYLDKVKADFLSLEDQILSEEVVKLSMLAPLLSVANFFREPLYPKAEVGVELEVTGENETLIRGRLDVLVVYRSFWLMAIETKRRNLTLETGFSQALFYLLNSPEPQPITYGFLTNGRHFQFIKRVGHQYATSDEFTLHRRVNELYVVVQIMKRLGAIMMQNTDETAA
ncbi:MAG: restriction endonuclease subunit R [Cyanobacteria bacterium P01_G01_bin.54]